MKRITVVVVILIGIPLGTYAMLWTLAYFGWLFDIHGPCARFSGMC